MYIPGLKQVSLDGIKLIEAIILSTWNWVTENSELRPGEEVLQEGVTEILQEMEEQMCVRHRPAVAPLATVRSMMDVGWVWGCMSPLLFTDNAVKRQLSEYLSALQIILERINSNASERSSD
jgi:hypothetical protein